MLALKLSLSEAEEWEWPLAKGKIRYPLLGEAVVHYKRKRRGFPEAIQKEHFPSSGFCLGCTRR
jgi:hypothetical protein